MLVLKDLSIEIPGTNMHYIGLDAFSQPDEETVLLYGFNNLLSNELFETIKHYRRKIYFNVTMPTEFCSDHDIALDNKFDEIYTICPYSVKWLNKIKSTNKYKFIWYPFDPDDIDFTSLNQEKFYDVCYHGGIHGDKYVNMLKTISKFNYVYMSMTHGINPLTQQSLSWATHTDLNHREKIDLISQCKMSVCFNNFPVRKEHNDLQSIQSQLHWEENETFKCAESHGIWPQIKSRLNEAAATKTLNLVERDPWNIIEHFYEPNKHFIYFDDLNDLQEKIFEISTDWDSYKHIAEASHAHFLNNYTTKILYDRIKKNENHSYRV